MPILVPAPSVTEITEPRSSEAIGATFLQASAEQKKQLIESFAMSMFGSLSESGGLMTDGAVAFDAELDYRNAPDLSREAARLVFKIVEGSSLVRGEGAYEFLLALVTHRLRLRPEHTVQILSIRSVPRRIATMLKLAKQRLV